MTTGTPNIKEKSDLSFLEEYQKELNIIYKTKNLLCLSDFDYVKFDGKNSIELFSDSVLKAKQKHEPIKDELRKLEIELIYSTSGNIKFCIGNLYLFKDFGINDFSTEKIIYDDGKRVSTYHMKPGELRYLFYAGVCFEKLYNFWDRIGDLLYWCLQLQIKEKGVYFPIVIDQIKSTSNNFLKLKSFKESDYKQLNEDRKQIVHYKQFDTEYWCKWFEHKNDEAKMAELQKQKEELIPLLNKHLQLTIKGFENACNFISE